MELAVNLRNGHLEFTSRPELVLGAARESGHNSICQNGLKVLLRERVGTVQKRVTAQGGWGRRPQGDAPRSEASALGARWLLPARPQPPRSCRPRRSGSGITPDPLRSRLSLSRLPAWPVLRSALLERPGIGSTLHASYATKSYISAAFREFANSGIDASC